MVWPAPMKTGIFEGVRNNRRRVLSLGLGLGALTLASGSASAAARATADETLKAELAAAEKDGKTLALFVQASWCPYCKLFGLLLKDSAAAPVLNAHFRFFWLNVRERKPEWQKRQLPGAMSVFKRYSGGGETVPFFAFLDKEGTALSTSNNPRGQNIGYPGTDEELDWYDAMFAKAAPKMTKAEIATVRAATVRLYHPKD